MNDEAMVFDPEKSQFFQLNPTAAFLWNRLEEPSTEERLADEVSKHFEGAPSADLARHINQLIEQMLANQLVVVVQST